MRPALLMPCAALCAVLGARGADAVEPAPAPQLTEDVRPGTLFVQAFSGLWMLEESSLERTSHPLVGATVGWALSPAWELSAQLRLTYDREGTSSLLQSSFVGALDALASYQWELNRVRLGLGAGLSGYLTATQFYLSQRAQPFFTQWAWGPSGTAFLRAPLTDRTAFQVSLLVADRGGKVDGLLLAGVRW